MKPSAVLLAPFLGLLEHLPANGWTREERDKFVAVFEAVLDFCVPIIESPPPPEAP